MNISGVSADGITNEVDFHIGGVAPGYSANDKIRNINRWYQKAFAVVMDSMAEWGFQETSGTATLSATIQNYFFPTNLLRLQRVDVSYDGSAWVRATPIDLREPSIALSLSADINAAYDAGSPRYDIRDYAGSTFVDLYPVPYSAVTGGAKFYYNTKLTYLSASADYPVFAEQFHSILGLGAAYDWARSRKMDIAASLKRDVDELMELMARHYGKRQMDRILGLERDPEQDDGQYD